MKEIIKENKLNVIFLVETDTAAINKDTDYQIEGFKTLIQNKKLETDQTRIICLVDSQLANHVIIRNDLTSTNFPSLWIEVENDNGKNFICGGVY